VFFLAIHGGKPHGMMEYSNIPIGAKPLVPHDRYESNYFKVSDPFCTSIKKVDKSNTV
jgi:hypothetical protein